ncbi:FAD/NAD(P)-binding oxidoreductase family protein [Wolffia australiana]
MLTVAPPRTAGGGPRSRRRSAIIAAAEAPPGAVVVGAGLAGLAAAARLRAAGVPVTVVEGSDGLGGRVRTDRVDGFLLDRGFQILITAYPEAKAVLDYEALDLRRFYSGALVHAGGGRFHRLADPLRHPIDGLLSLLNPIGTPADKVRVGLARLRAAVRADPDLLTAPELPIRSRLAADGFSPSMVDQFFRPFFGGVFFDPDLSTTSRLFDFVFKCLALGDNALPAAGIGSIADQLAAKLPPQSLLLRTTALALDRSLVRTDRGDVPAPLGVILAVPAPEAAQLLGRGPPPGRPPRGTTCVYFAADRAAVPGPVLLLNGTGRGRVNNMFFASEVAPSYAPPGTALVSASLIGAAAEGEDVAAAVAAELGEWFGAAEVATWRHLRTYRIAYAQPDQSPPTELVGREVRAGGGVYLCGDFMRSATFDGALVSGRLAAEALISDRWSQV